MAFDIAIDYTTGDLIASPSHDLSVRTAQEVLEQRIRVRLKILAGEWHLDPTGGTLGSRLRDVARVPTWRGITEAPMMVREALEPMDDLKVDEVTCTIDPNDSRRLLVTLRYSAVEPEEDETVEDQELTTSIQIAG